MGHLTGKLDSGRCFVRIFSLYIDKVDQGLKDKRTKVLAGRCVYRTGEIDIMGNKYEI